MGKVLEYSQEKTYAAITNYLIKAKKIRKPKAARLFFNREKLKDPHIDNTFKAELGGRFAPLLLMDNI